MSDSAHPSLCGTSSRKEQGQVLPLLALLMALLAALGISLAGFLFSSAKRLSQDEAEFQEMFKRGMKTANLLNTIAENNFRMARILEEVTDIFRTAAGRSLDVAASSPLWEQELPRALIQKNFSTFLSVAPNAAQVLRQLAAANRTAVQEIPTELRSRFKPLNFSETLCVLFASPGQREAAGSLSPQSGGCQLVATQTFLSAPPLRQLTDLRSLTFHFGPTDGVTLILFGNDLRLNGKLQFQMGGTTGLERQSIDSPFAQKELFLTHAAFCRQRAKKELASLCPAFRFPETWSRNGFSLQSAFPNWTISIEDKSNEI